MHKTSNLKLSFLGIIPTLADKTGALAPEQIVALSALLTFKGKSVKKLLQETKEKGQNLNQKVENILKKSALRGHASMATTPTISIAWEGSKFLDSALTGLVFSSSLMASGRRTSTTPSDIIFPTQIAKKKVAKKIFQKTISQNINFFNFLLAKNIPKDEASKILPYGIYGTGVMVLPIESILAIKREWTQEKEWMPEEVGLLLEKIEKNLKKLRIEKLYWTRWLSPRNIYLYPNIFKDPKVPNLSRDLATKFLKNNNFKIITVETDQQLDGLKNRLKELKKIQQAIFSNKAKIKKYWPKILYQYQQVLRDYNQAIKIQSISRVAWRVWGEKKRHRTVPQVVDSIYYSTEQALKALKKSKLLITNYQLLFSIPPTIRNNPNFVKKYIECFVDSISCYQKLIQMGIKPRDAIFVIPRGIKISVVQTFDLFNLIAGYYPLRLCSTADEEIHRISWQEAIAIKKELSQKRLSLLADFIVPKCLMFGFCNEEKLCGQIKAKVKDYDEKFHQEMLESLEKRYKIALKS